MTEQLHYSIGEVVAKLSQEYPDLTISSLRFLDEEGLVKPERTDGGHRRYSDRDIEWVRFIKEMQRRYFPLSVIKDLLHKANNDKGRGETILFRPTHYDADFVPLNRSELSQACGLSETHLAEMRSLGMITPSAEGAYNEDDLYAAKTMKGLVDYGLEPADLSFYTSHINDVVEGELRLLIGKIMAKRNVYEMGTVVLRVEELDDELWRVLHAKALRKRARQLVDELQQQFEHVGQGG